MGSSDPLYGPQGVAVTSSGNIAVADSGNHCIKVYKYHHYFEKTKNTAGEERTEQAADEQTEQAAENAAAGGSIERDGKAEPGEQNGNHEGEKRERPEGDNEAGGIRK